MPYSELFEFVHLNIPKVNDGSTSGFEMDMKKVLKLIETAKAICDERARSLNEEKWIHLLDEIDDLVAWFYPAEKVPGVTTRIDPDDLPQVKIGETPNRAVRREVKRKVKAVWRNGRWEQDAGSA